MDCSFHHDKETNQQKLGLVGFNERILSMTVNRLFLGFLVSSFLFLACSSTSFAIDIKSSSSTAQMGEAAAFFNRIISTSSNPIIVNMARENLKTLGDSKMLAYSAPTSNFPQDEKSAKTLTEVQLVPQTDSTYVVSAVVNTRHAATFLVDTGASYTVITPRMAKQLGLKLGEDSATVPVATANGTVYAPLVKLKQLSLGGMHVENVEAVVADLGDNNPISGLLGMSFFHGMELSFKQDKLVIGR
jgi:clan AA aspartic protease (TIGR02281 family)